jgi:hypothetical protein
MSTPARPALKFATLDALLADVDRLRGGYERAGRWELGPMLDHVAKMMSTPFEPGQWNLPGPAVAVARFCIRQMVRRNWYPTMVTFPAPPSIRPTEGVDADAAVAHLREVVDQIRALPDGPVTCPPFGRIAKGDYVGLQLLHAAHHLSYLKPTVA